MVVRLGQFSFLDWVRADLCTTTIIMWVWRKADFDHLYPTADPFSLVQADLEWTSILVLFKVSSKVRSSCGSAGIDPTAPSPRTPGRTGRGPTSAPPQSSFGSGGEGPIGLLL